MLSKVFCFRLKTAGIVIGGLGVLASILIAIYICLILGRAEYNVDELFFLNVDVEGSNFVNKCRICLIMAGLNLVASGMLIFGTIKARHLMLLPWLIISGIQIVAAIIYCIALIRVLFINSSEKVLHDIFMTDLFLAWQIYSYYGIYSLYKQIQPTRKEKLPLIN